MIDTKERSRMNYSKDLNISGNRIINVQDPTEPNHVATKKYTDIVHNLTPLSNKYEYIHYINLRNITLHSIAGISKVTTTWAHTPAQNYYEGMEQFWLESSACTLKYRLDKQDLKEKYIQLDFQQPLMIQELTLLFYHDEYVNIKIKYIWQVSEDKKNWNATTLIPNETKSKEQTWNGNNGMIKFINEPHIHFPYWRLLIAEGEIEEEHKNPWLNLLLLKVEV